jgi:hypothetical protein
MSYEPKDDLLLDIPVIKNKIDHIEARLDKYDQLAEKLTENMSLLSQRMVAEEITTKHVDSKLKWVLGIITTVAGGMIALLLQNYLK